MSTSIIKEYTIAIKGYEEALKTCKGSSDILYYEKHIKLLQDKIKELEGEV